MAQVPSPAFSYFYFFGKVPENIFLRYCKETPTSLFINKIKVERKLLTCSVHHVLLSGDTAGLTYRKEKSEL